MPDPWLEAAFATYRDMKDMGNAHTWVTDDLQFLVCFPEKGWLRQREGRPPDRIATFEWEGKTYERSKWAFYFRRPDPRPNFVPKPSVSDNFMFDEMPVLAIVVDGEPYLLHLTKTGPVLAPLVRGTRLSSAVPPGDGWPSFPSDIQHDPAAAELLFFGRNDIRNGATIDGSVVLFRWSYRKDAMTRVPLPTEELFRRTLFGHFTPKNPLPIADR